MAEFSTGLFARPPPQIFKLRKPDYCEPDEEWSAWTICEAYAQKKGFFIHKGKGKPGHGAKTM